MRTVSTIINGLCLLILADAVMSWFMPETQFPRSLTVQVTGPLYAPIRSVLTPEVTGRIDFAPLIWLVGLQAFDRWLRKRGRAGLRR